MSKKKDGKITTSENKNNLLKLKIPNQKSMIFTYMFFSLTITLQTAMQMLYLTIDLITEH